MAGRPQAGDDTDPPAVRILVVTHYFPPEIGAPQSRLSDLARLWAEAGDRVTVLTGMPNHPTGVVPPEYRGRLRVEEEVDGYRVVRTWLYATPNERIVRKTIGHVSFMVSSVVLGARRAGRADVVVVSSPTFFSIFSGWLIARARRARFVVEIRDLWPAIFVELGMLHSRFAIWLLTGLEMASYRAADAVVVVSEGFRDDLLRRGIDPAKVHVVRNGVDVDAFVPLEPDSSARERLGATNGDTLVLYVGAHGISHGLEAVAEAAAELTGEGVQFAFVGEGSAKRRLLERVSELAVSNIKTLPGVPHREVPGLLAAADICLVPMRDVPLFASFIPSKIFEYLAAGKAVVGSVRGEPAAILTEAGAVVVEPEDPAALADAIRGLAADPERRAAMGGRGRRHVVEHFDRRRLATKYRAILQQAADGW
jgi:glycosyltransferase involved in cell wall biosynthesis